MKSPAFQFYAADYLASQRVQMMSLAEEGAYMRLLAFCWLHGSIPSEPEQVARLIGKGASTTLATTVLTMFQPAPNGEGMIHDRLEHERAKQAEWRAKSALGGRKSGESRKGGMKGGSRVAQPPYEPNGNISSSSSSSNKRERVGAGLPSLEEAQNAADQIGVTKQEAEEWWYARDASNWTRGTAGGGSVAIGNWRSDMKAWTNTKRERLATSRPHAANGPTPARTNGAPSAWSLKAQIQAAEDTIAKIRGINLFKNLPEDKKAKITELRAHIAELNKQLIGA